MGPESCACTQFTYGRFDGGSGRCVVCGGMKALPSGGAALVAPTGQERQMVPVEFLAKDPPTTEKLSAPIARLAAEILAKKGKPIELKPDVEIVPPPNPRGRVTQVSRKGGRVLVTVLAWAHELAQACITASGTECE